MVNNIIPSLLVLIVGKRLGKGKKSVDQLNF